ncbi:MAG: glycine-rich protein [Nocardioides sp.]
MTAAALVAVDLAQAPDAEAAVVPTTSVFDTPGTSLFTVPAGITAIKVTAIGAAGGTCYDARGGYGGEVTATIPVTPGSTLNVGVGGAGPVVRTCEPAGTPGGTGGGGAGGVVDAFDHTGGAGGGGASWLSAGAGSPTLVSAIVVAAGGGGAVYGTNGGDAGSPGYNDGAGGAGTQTAGGAGGAASSSSATSGGTGMAFTGGAGGGSSDFRGAGGGGGGGGYYGGGGGAGAGSSAARPGSGGGGSNFVVANAYASSPATVSQSAASVSITYPAALPPSATISAPATGGGYTVDQVVPTTFSCAEGADGPGLASCDDNHGVSTTDGGTGTLDTSEPGNYEYIVTATSSGGLTSITKIAYTVNPGEPTATIASPLPGGTYVVGERVPTTFSCSAGAGTIIYYCYDDGRQFEGSGFLDTSRAGDHTYTVTATALWWGPDVGSLQTTTQISYKVVHSPPTATIASPAAGGTYRMGQVVPTTFTCDDGDFGPGVESCNDNHGTESATGATGTLDTSRAGSRTYTVTSRSTSGSASTTSISYQVTPAKVAIKTSEATVADGKTKVAVTCAGAVLCRGTLKLVQNKSVVATARYSSAGGSKVTVTLKLTKVGKKLMEKAKKRGITTRATASVAGGTTASRTIVLKPR